MPEYDINLMVPSVPRYLLDDWVLYASGFKVLKFSDSNLEGVFSNLLDFL